MGSIGTRFQATFARRMAQIGTTAVITKMLASSYDTATTEAAPAGDAFTVKGFFDDAKGGYSDGATDAQLAGRVFCVATQDVDGNPIAFDPAIGHTATIGSQAFS